MLLRPPPPTDLRPFVAMDWRLRGISLWRRSAREDGITLWRLFTSLTPSALMRRCGGIARAVQGPPSSGGDRVFQRSTVKFKVVLLPLPDLSRRWPCAWLMKRTSADSLLESPPAAATRVAQRGTLSALYIVHCTLYTVHCTL